MHLEEEEVCLTSDKERQGNGNIVWFLSRSIANCNKSVDIRLVITLIAHPFPIAISQSGAVPTNTLFTINSVTTV